MKVFMLINIQGDILYSLSLYFGTYILRLRCFSFADRSYHLSTDLSIIQNILFFLWKIPRSSFFLYFYILLYKKQFFNWTVPFDLSVLPKKYKYNKKIFFLFFIDRATKIAFVVNQLYPGSIGMYPLTTTHLRILQHSPILPI